MLSPEARLVAGITLITVPTVAYGGITILGILTGNEAGYGPPDLELTDRQYALFRAGHAHAGVWVILSLVVQMLLDSATLSNPIKWIARIAVPLAAISISGGFFGLAFAPEFRWLIYVGGGLLAATVLITGIGLIRRPQT
jgi:hypothetical protein